MTHPAVHTSLLSTLTPAHPTSPCAHRFTERKGPYRIIHHQTAPEEVEELLAAWTWRQLGREPTLLEVVPVRAARAVVVSKALLAAWAWRKPGREPTFLEAVKEKWQCEKQRRRMEGPGLG